MKKILIALLAIVMITGCSTSKKTQTLFVEKNKKYVVESVEVFALSIIYHFENKINLFLRKNFKYN